MYREEVVKIMTDAINNYNKAMAQNANIPPEQFEAVLEQQQDQLNTVNGMLYDVLKYNGVIA